MRPPSEISQRPGRLALAPASTSKDPNMALVTSISEADRIRRAQAPSRPVEFEVKRRLKLWVVLRNGVYSGSFPEEDGALQAAAREINAIIRAGGKASMRDNAT